MKVLIFLAGAAALATPSIAQMNAPSTATPPPSTAPSAAPPVSDPMAAQTAPAAAPSDPKAIIAAEFPTYDKDGNGTLSRAEFDAWLMALKEKSGQPMKPGEQTAWLKTAFATADKDKDKSVSLAELTTYLTAQG